MTDQMNDYLKSIRDEQSKVNAEQSNVDFTRLTLLRGLVKTYVANGGNTTIDLENTDPIGIGAVYTGAEMLVNGVITIVEIENNGYFSLSIKDVETSDVFGDCRLEDTLNNREIIDNLIDYFVEQLETL